MRYQERIYMQTANSCIRNKDHINFNMSSDICIFNKPIFIMYGAGKIASPIYVSDSLVHIINDETSVNLTFEFTDVTTFEEINTTFKYKIYKYNPSTSVFSTPPVYQSASLPFSSFSGTNVISTTILNSSLNIDGEYLIKGSYDFTPCTEIMSKLGIIINTGIPLIGTEYGLYESEYDYYFTVITNASKPQFTLTQLDTTKLGSLVVQSFILEANETTIILTNQWSGDMIVALNGLTLAINDDYTTLNDTLYLNGGISLDDILTVAYVLGADSNGLTSESIIVDGVIVSGVTDGEGTNKIYYNTDINKFEIYTLVDPFIFNDVVVTLNGVTLANILDYNQSTVNPRRIILTGTIYSYTELTTGGPDIITIVYNANSTYVGSINTVIFNLAWTIAIPPVNTNGFFTTLVATDDTYSDIIFSAVTPYITNEVSYTSSVDLTSYSGTTAIYKVVNQKNYTLISGDVISTFSDSEEIPIEITV